MLYTTEDYPKRFSNVDYQELQENEDAFMHWVFEMEQAYEESKYDEMFKEDIDDNR